MEEVYKGYIIKYSETSNNFRASIGDSDYLNPSLEKVKRYIDNLERKDFKRTDVIFSSWRSSGKYQSGTVTSEVQSSRESNEVWISYKDNYKRLTRVKQLASSVFLDNPHNRGIVNKIMQKREAIKTLQEEIQKHQEEFEEYKVGQ